MNKTILAAVAMASTCLWITSANAGMYMKVPGVSGDATEIGYERQIEITSFQWGLSNDLTSRRGCTSISDVTITKMLDSATPALIGSSIVGQTFPSIEIAWTKASPDRSVTYLKLRMTNAQFNSYSNSSGGDRPNESLSLHFDSMDGEYIPIDPEGGKPGAPIKWTVVDQSMATCP